MAPIKKAIQAIVFRFIKRLIPLRTIVKKMKTTNNMINISVASLLA